MSVKLVGAVGPHCVITSKLPCAVGLFLCPTPSVTIALVILRIRFSTKVSSMRLGNESLEPNQSGWLQVQFSFTQRGGHAQTVSSKLADQRLRAGNGHEPGRRSSTFGGANNLAIDAGFRTPMIAGKFGTAFYLCDAIRIWEHDRAGNPTCWFAVTAVPCATRCPFSCVSNSCGKRGSPNIARSAPGRSCARLSIRSTNCRTAS